MTGTCMVPVHVRCKFSRSNAVLLTCLGTRKVRCVDATLPQSTPRLTSTCSQPTGLLSLLHPPHAPIGYMHLHHQLGRHLAVHGVLLESLPTSPSLSSANAITAAPAAPEVERGTTSSIQQLLPTAQGVLSSLSLASFMPTTRGICICSSRADADGIYSFNRCHWEPTVCRAPA